MSSRHPSYTPSSAPGATLLLLSAATGACRGDTRVATAVMLRDGAGAWRQAIFLPTLLSLRGGWGIVQPRENLVVTAAEVEGPCR